MTISRDWTPIESDDKWQDENYYDEVKDQCDLLAKEWSRIATEMEDVDFRNRFDEEEGYVDYDFEDEAEQKYHQAVRRLARKLKQAQLDTIEAELDTLGARLMRPYEHWNEDEAYMEYQERDRDY